MRKVYVFTILTLMQLSFPQISAQNLVPNPSFELFSTGCPTNQDQIDKADYWIKPDPYPTPDYYNACATSTPVHVPTNTLGTQYARTGDAYAGLYVTHPTVLAREYIETPLTATLVSGQDYIVSFYVSLADQSEYGADGIGAYLSAGTQFPTTMIQLLTLTEQISNPTGVILCDINGWVQVSGRFTALGGEDHLVLGNFKYDNELNTRQVGPPGLGTYYYIDDVEVRAIENESCEFYKPGFKDYCPNGMPDFDQKQQDWQTASGQWTWDGPTALANCLWWFDSRFETYPLDPRPFYYPPNLGQVSNNYPLIDSYAPYEWDDHDTNNVVPFIEDLKTYCNTDGGGQMGTILWDLEFGFQNYVVNIPDLPHVYNTHILLGPEFTEIRDSLLSCQDVILLFSFYEPDPGGTYCTWLGGHYVTMAGVCKTSTDICISDPFLDANEGEPPLGANGHIPSVHNDAFNVSGPHGLNDHDWYHLEPWSNPDCTAPAVWEVVNYPDDWMSVVIEFAALNSIDPVPNPTYPFYNGGDIVVLLDAALIICPNNCYSTADIDNDGNPLTQTDKTALEDFVNTGSPVPQHIWQCDLNGDGFVDWLDVAVFNNYFIVGMSAFTHGYPVSVPCCPDTVRSACCIQNSCFVLAPDNCAAFSGTNAGTGLACIPDPCTNKCCIGFTGNVNCSEDEEPDISDITRLIDYLYISHSELCCLEEADANASGGQPDISDITRLIDYLYLTHAVLPDCPEDE